MFKRKTKRILQKYPEQEIILKSIGANFFGQESKGVWQIKGNGVLLLTDYELFYEMWLPDKILRIPIKLIKKTEKTKWHLKKSKGRPLLKVHFTNKKGKKDSAAWLVRNVETWINTIDSLLLTDQTF